MSSYQCCPGHREQYYDLLLKHLEETKEFRKQIYDRVNIANVRRILEIGCRMGYLTKEIREFSNAQITAIDSDHKILAEAMDRVSGVEFYRETGEKLSMRDESFDIIISHYLFMWADKPFGSLMELVRVCKPNGYVIAIAEPDIKAWIEDPDLGFEDYQYEVVRKLQGNPEIGRKLYALFTSAGLETDIYVNVHIWEEKSMKDFVLKGWQIVQDEGILTPEECQAKIEKELEIIESHLRFLAIPTITAVGRKKAKKQE